MSAVEAADLLLGEAVAMVLVGPACTVRGGLERT
jgi:hypothetical protein